MKNCKKCGEEKPITDYYKHPDTKDGHFAVCKPCYKGRENVKSRLRTGFANLRPDYCECCGDAEAKLSLDHCHQTNLFRGFICRSCNKTIGAMGDTYEKLLEADADPMYLDYLRLSIYRQGKSL